MAYAGVIVALVAAGAAAYSTFQQNANAQAQARAQQEALEQDARNRDLLAAAKVKAGQKAAERFLQGQRAAAAKSGVRVDEGSFLEGQLEAAQIGEFESQLAGFGDVLGAAGARQGAALARFQRRTLRSQQWSSTLISGVAAGLSTYAGVGGFSTPAADTSGLGPVGSRVGGTTIATSGPTQSRLQINSGLVP